MNYAKNIKEIEDGQLAATSQQGKEELDPAGLYRQYITELFTPSIRKYSETGGIGCMKRIIIKIVAGLLITGAAGWIPVLVAVVHVEEDMRICEDW